MLPGVLPPSRTDARMTREVFDLFGVAQEGLKGDGNPSASGEVQFLTGTIFGDEVFYDCDAVSVLLRCNHGTLGECEENMTDEPIGQGNRFSYARPDMVQVARDRRDDWVEEKNSRFVQRTANR